MKHTPYKLNKLTRRKAIMLAAISPLVAIRPQVVFAANTTVLDQLVSRLADAKLPFAAALEVVSYKEEMHNDGVHLAAVVRMTWAPGTRSAHFSLTKPDAGDALDHLSDSIIQKFAAAI